MAEPKKRSEIRVPAPIFDTFLDRCGEVGCDMNPAIIAFMVCVNRGDLQLHVPTAVKVAVVDSSGVVVGENEITPNNRTKRRDLIKAGAAKRQGS
jgi:hypothetical protein